MIRRSAMLPATLAIVGREDIHACELATFSKVSLWSANKSAVLIRDRRRYLKTLICPGFKVGGREFGYMELMSLSGMVEIPRLQAKRGFGMPAKAASIFGFVGRPKKTWIPAYAGMTKGRVDF